MSPDFDDLDLPFDVILPPKKVVVWPEEDWDRWVLERHAELFAAGLLKPDPMPRNFEALDLDGYELNEERLTP